MTFSLAHGGRGFPVPGCKALMLALAVAAGSGSPCAAQESRPQLSDVLSPTWSAGVNAQAPPSPGMAAMHNTVSPAPAEDPGTAFRNRAIIAGTVIGVTAYGMAKWWDSGFESRFKRRDEGWFSQHTYSGGADKLGHFYINYAGTRLLKPVFEWAGNDSDRALALAGLTLFGTMTAVEVLDGYSRRWTFSKEDALINAMGLGAAIFFERHPEWDRLIDLRLLYRSSGAEGGGWNPASDYSGQTYLLVLKANGIPALREHAVMRYLEFAVGYGTRDYRSEQGRLTAEGTRNLYVGVSLNLTEVLRNTAFRDSPPQSGIRRATETVLEYVQPPFTAALARHRLGR